MNRLNTIATPEVGSGLLLASVFRYLPCNSARFCPLAGAFGVPQVSPLPARRKVVLHKGCSTRALRSPWCEACSTVVCLQVKHRKFTS
ncbi:ABC transporter BEA3 [Fusarium oxysporum f. sp. albedinis]|nr:ABC transporter BEA3 [Fusarium oxysporum f. sp. albedinis]